MLLQEHHTGRTAELPSGVFVIRRTDDVEIHVWAIPGDAGQGLVIAEYVPERGEYINEVQVSLDRRSCAELAGYVLRSSC
jgi:hypothetical protein